MLLLENIDANSSLRKVLPCVQFYVEIAKAMLFVHYSQTIWLSEISKYTYSTAVMHQGMDG